MDQVVAAIEVFYAPSTAAEVRRESGQFLERFQNTVNVGGIRNNISWLINTA